MKKNIYICIYKCISKCIYAYRLFEEKTLVQKLHALCDYQYTIGTML